MLQKTFYMALDTELPRYIPIPLYVLDMCLSMTARIIYGLLLSRARLSQKSKWVDDLGRVYVIFPIKDLAALVDRSETSVKGALAELEYQDLIERAPHPHSSVNRLYVKIIPEPGDKIIEMKEPPGPRHYYGRGEDNL